MEFKVGVSLGVMVRVRVGFRVKVTVGFTVGVRFKLMIRARDWV